MKFIIIKNPIEKLLNLLCKIINCEKFIIFRSNNSLLPNNFSHCRHINNFNENDFPMNYIFNFFKLAKEQLSTTISDPLDMDNENYDEDEKYTSILLTLKVKSCNTKIIAGNFHEFPFYVSLNDYNNQLVLNNIPVNLNDDKNNFDLICYLSKLTNEYCSEIDEYKFGESVDLIFEYKFISYNEYCNHIKNLHKSFENKD